jgi:hypothetical protein
MMKLNSKLVTRTLTFLVLLTLIAGAVFEASGQTRRRARRGRRPAAAAPAIKYYTVPTNTVIRARINQQLNSGTARIGDRFTSNVIEPVYTSNGVEVIQVGSTVGGRVTQVTRAGKRTPGNITVAFDSIRLPSGRTAVINGSLTTLEADNVNSDNEGTVKGTSNKKRDAVFIGGGVGAGAIIGGIAGGGKGALIGGILGGALGTGARVLEKEKEAQVKSGTEFGVILNRSVSLPASTVR